MTELGRSEELEQARKRGLVEAFARGARRRLPVLVPQLAMIGAVVAVWFWQSRPGHVSPLLLPKPETVASHLWSLLAGATLWSSLRVTATELVGAFAISALGGLAVGALAGSSRYRARLAEPLLGWIQVVPIVLFYPICILIFGLGEESKIVFAGVYGFFPVAISTIRGVDSVDERYTRAAVSMGASRRQLFLQVRLRAALPLIVAGIRLGAALNLIGVLAGEILGSTGGLGYQISASSQNFEPEDMYAYMVVALVLVALFNLALSRTESRSAAR